jgi:hypothetical protein
MQHGFIGSDVTTVVSARIVLFTTSRSTGVMLDQVRGIRAALEGRRASVWKLVLDVQSWSVDESVKLIPPDRPLGRHPHSAIDIRNFRHAYRSDGICCLSPLRHQHINLPQLRNDFFSRMPLGCHRSYPIREIYFRDDRFKGAYHQSPPFFIRASRENLIFGAG